MVRGVVITIILEPASNGFAMCGKRCQGLAAWPGKPNAAAEHDLGLASGSLTLEATARGLSVHQMIGILPDIARDAYRIPEGFRALTALAIGYAGDPEQADGKLGDRDKGTRSRKPLSEIVFGDAWGVASPLTQT